MDVGFALPQGCDGEFHGWPAEEAWRAWSSWPRRRIGRGAVRFADEINLHGPDDGAVVTALARIEAICAEAGRARETLRVSIHTAFRRSLSRLQRRERMRRYRDLGLDGVIIQGMPAASDPSWMDEVAEDCEGIGLLAEGGRPADG